MNQRPFVGIFIFWSIGIVLERYLPEAFPIVTALSGVFILLAILWPRRWRGWAVCLGLSLIGASFIYAQSFRSLPQDHLHHVARYYKGQMAALKGTIITDVETRSFFNRKKIVFTLDVKELKTPWGWRPKSGRIMVNMFQDRDLHYGDFVLIEGKLHRPYNFSEGNFSYTDYLEMKGVYWILSVSRQASVEILKEGSENNWLAGVFRWKDQLNKAFFEYLTPAEAGLMSAIILGDRAGTPPHIMELFEHTGTVHVLAISGFNIGIVAGLFLLVIKVLPLGRKPQLLITIGLLIVYCILTGSRPSVVRATIMAIVFLFSFILERRTDPFNTLGLAGFLLLMIHPFNLFDIGFQLSFLAVLIIIGAGPLLEAVSARFSEKYIQVLIKALGMSFAIWLGLEGLIVYYFQIVTPIIIFANLIVIPLISAVIALGLGFLAVVFVSGYCAQMFALCLKVLLNLTVASIYLMDKVPGAYVLTPVFSFWHIAVYYLIGAGLIFLLSFRSFIRACYNKPKSQILNPS